MTVGAVIVGIVLVIVAILYWITPAGSLPGFAPGFEAGSTHIHIKHGVAAFILALALFALAWFKSGPAETGATPPASTN